MVYILFSLRERMSEGQVRARVILKDKSVLRRIIIILPKALSLIPAVAGPPSPEGRRGNLYYSVWTLSSDLNVVEASSK